MHTVVTQRGCCKTEAGISSRKLGETRVEKKRRADEKMPQMVHEEMAYMAGLSSRWFSNPVIFQPLGILIGPLCFFFISLFPVCSLGSWDIETHPPQLGCIRASLSFWSFRVATPSRSLLRTLMISTGGAQDEGNWKHSVCIRPEFSFEANPARVQMGPSI